MTKQCRKCGEHRPLDQFSKSPSSSDGLENRCKPCVRLLSKEWHVKNKERHAVNGKNWRKRNADALRDYAKRWREENYDKVLQYGRDWYAKNREKALASDKAQRDANREKFLAREQESYARNAEKRRAKEVRWRAENPDKICAYAAQRRAEKAKRTPSWLTPVQIREMDSFYEQAAFLKEVSSEDWHVDHIIPLRGRKVSGLHVPWNLQVVPAIVNLKKTNKYEP